MNILKIKPIPRHHLAKIQTIKRKQHHPLLHMLHEKHRISKKTLFYMKEYGPHSHVAHTIIKESIGIILLAALISSFGGFALEQIKTAFVTIIPFIILLPVLNGMIGDFGIIFSSKIATGLYKGEIKTPSLRDAYVRNIFKNVLIIAIASSIISSGLAILISIITGHAVLMHVIGKIFLIILLDVLLLVCLLYATTISAAFYFYKKKEDPNNFLIPISTSIADFGNMVLLTGLILLLF